MRRPAWFGKSLKFRKSRPHEQVASSAESFAFGSVGFGGHACQFLFYQAKFMQKLAKSFTLCGVWGGKVQSRTRASRGARSQFQTPNIKNIESDLVAFMNLT